MTQLPIHVESLDYVPRKLRSLYESVSVGDGFALNSAGRALAGFRAALAKEPFKEPTAQIHVLTRSQWSLLAALAEAGDERAHFLKAASASASKCWTSDG
jgi:hypothetical protein